MLAMVANEANTDDLLSYVQLLRLKLVCERIVHGCTMYIGRRFEFKPGKKM